MPAAFVSSGRGHVDAAVTQQIVRPNPNLIHTYR